MRVIFLGPPGAGKGTQAGTLAAEWGVPHIATGNMLREAAAHGTKLGLEARAYMERGDLVPDEVMIGVVAERLGQSDAREGFLLDGFPRTVAQAEALESLLKDSGLELSRVIFFQVSPDELVRRLTGRRVCKRCASNFHLFFAPPKVAGVCDRCGGELYQREDDREATVRGRLEIYAERTAPLLDYYRNRGLLLSVGGEGAPEAVASCIREAVGQ